jgi:DNA-binding transcriptional regulator YdaS (Cro superfamily)
MMTPDLALRRALDFFGGHRAMACALGISPDDLTGARVRGKVSGEIAEKIDKMTAGKVRREELRPDLYPRDHHFNRIRAQKINARRNRKTAAFPFVLAQR